MTHSICDVCIGVLEHRLNPINTDTFPGGAIAGKETCSLPNDFGHHRSWDSLYASADANCWICSRVANVPSIPTKARNLSSYMMAYGQSFTNNICLHGFVDTIEIKPPSSEGITTMNVYYVQGDDCETQVLWLTFQMMEIQGKRVVHYRAKVVS